MYSFGGVMDSRISIPIRQATPLPGLFNRRAERIRVHITFGPRTVIVQADLSACDPETIQVAISSRTLLIVAHRKNHSVPRAQSDHRRLPEKAFVGRTLELPIDLLSRKPVRARLDHGLLRVTIPCTHSACAQVEVELPVSPTEPPDGPPTDASSRIVSHLHRFRQYPGPQRRLTRVRCRPHT